MQKKKPKIKEPHGTRELIIKVATRLFAENGYDGTKIRDLVQEAKINISLVSYHFKGKNELYWACINQIDTERIKRSHNILEPANTLDELRVRLELFLTHLIDFHLENHNLFKIIQNEMKNDDPRFKPFEDLFTKGIIKTIEFFTRAKKNNLVRSELDPKILSMLFIALTSFFIQKDKSLPTQMFNKLYGNEKIVHDIIKHIINVFIDGIKTD